jgi:phage terminase large subunit-like protein
MIDESKALRVKTFAENLTYSKGVWAGQPFRMMPWVWEKIVLPGFGTLRKDGRRQYRFIYVEVPKKSGKTEVGAVLALYMLCADGEGKPEVFSAAGDREQAGLVYSAAAQMVRHSPVLSKILTVLDSRKRIINKKNNGFYQVLSSESELQHGLSPSAIIFDELHAQPNDRLWNVLTSGTDYARSQQLVVVLTTAGVYNKNSIWWKTRTKAIQISKGIVKQANFLPVLYIADAEKDDPADEKVWKRVNPSLGQIFTIDKIREDFESVKYDPVEYQNFLRFRLNIPIKNLIRFWPTDKWDACAGNIDIETLKGRPCYGGIDLAQTIDLSAFILVFPATTEGEKPVIISRFYCPEENILSRSRTDKVHYDIWAAQGYMKATPGDVVDLEYIKNDVLWAQKEFDLREIAYDKRFADHFASDLFNNHDIAMIEMPQLAKYFNEPIHSLMREVIAGRVLHDGNPILRWNFDNMVTKPRPDGSIQPDKSRSTEKIDGAVATFMAWGRAIQGGVVSAYDGLSSEEILKNMRF